MNYFYEVSIIGKNLAPLTYMSKEKLTKGMFVRVAVRGKVQEGVIINEVEKPLFSCLPITERLAYILPQSYLDIMTFVSSYYVCELGVALSLLTPVQGGEIFLPYTPLSNLTLSPLQQEALNFIMAHPASLLFGDTGSGKSEIYIAYIDHVLAQGKTAIVLMPEIALTPQMENRFSHYFGPSVALWHSRQTKKTKEKIRERIEKGEIRILLGARSALFVTLSNIGVIIVDEEHDDSYKSSANPQYNARDTALMLGKYLGATVILGSATPALTTWSRLPYFRLKGGYFEGERYVSFEEGNDELSPALLAKIDKVLAQQSQVIIFVPTRAHFRYMACRECGHLFECPSCSVAMSLHRHKNALVCHYCQKTTPIPHCCPQCGSNDFHATRNGTAQIVEMLREQYSYIRIERFDKDEMTSETRLKTLLHEFNNKKIDVLVGTQMIAKGHDYHNVGLVVILGIDYILGVPDYRSREKALALLVQLCGRTGRNGIGEVAVLTHNKNFFIPFLADYEAFLRQELVFRQGLYPPFKRLALLRIEDKNETAAEQKALSLVHEFAAFSLVETVGWGKAPIEKVANKWRYNILLRADSPRALWEILYPRKEMCHITMEPLDLS